MVGGVPIVRVVQRREIHGHADGIPSFLDVLQHARIPHAFFPLAVGSVVVEVAELADERTLPDARAPDNRHAHSGL